MGTPPGWNASLSQVTLPKLSRRYPFIHLNGEKLKVLKVKCLTQEHNTMTPASA